MSLGKLSGSEGTLSFEVDTNQAAWNKLLNKVERGLNLGVPMEPMLRKIAALMDYVVSQRFDEQGFDGEPWAPDRPCTVKKKKHRTILLETGALQSSIQTHIDMAEGWVTVTANTPYATTMQFGAKVGQFGFMGNGQPIPWGTIPPRPFMGLTTDEVLTMRDYVASLVIRHLENLMVAL